MRWFGFSGLKFLVSEIKGRELLNMQAINNTFNEVYDNMDKLDKRIDDLHYRSGAAYLGNCYCGSAYLGAVSETDTKRRESGG